MSTQIPTPRTDKVAGNIRITAVDGIEFLPSTFGEFVKAEDMFDLERELHTALAERDAARLDAERLAKALNQLMQCADPNINNCTDEELQEAVKYGFAPEIIQQAEAFLESRQAFAQHKALTQQTPA